MTKASRRKAEQKKVVSEPRFIRSLRRAAGDAGLTHSGADERRLAGLLDMVVKEGGKRKEKQIHVLLLGDSMFGYFLTAGRDTQFGTCMTIEPDARLVPPTQSQVPRVFNAGVVWDRIHDVAYRLVQGGLLSQLKRVGVEFIMVQLGTFNLKNDTKPLTDGIVEVYTWILEALRWACGPDVRICVCALNPKRRVKRAGIVEESNRKLEEMVGRLFEGEQESDSEEIEGESGSEDNGVLEQGSVPWVEFMPNDERLIDHLAVDGTNLNPDGYKIRAQNLWERLQEMKERAARETVSQDLDSEHQI